MKLLSGSPDDSRGTLFPSERNKLQFVLRSLCWLLAPALFSIGCDRSAPAPIYFVNQIASAKASFNEVQHRSFRKDGRLSAAITFDGETRRSLVPPLPSVLTFSVRLPADAAFRFAIGIKTLQDDRRFPRVRFRLFVESKGGRQTVFDERLGMGQVNRWFDREVNLVAFSGSSVEIGFETQIGEEAETNPELTAGILPLWGNPVISGSNIPREQPNLILISLDCVRPDHIGAYGYSRRTTPHIDRFAEDGVVFETAVSTAPETLPSHVSMLTGLPPSWHGASNWAGFSPSVGYLPDLLSEAGYESAGAVSAPWLSDAFGVERGYHLYRTFDQPRAGRVVDYALDLLERARDRPQFLFLHLFDAHWPYVPPREFIERFGERPADISDLMRKVGEEEPPSSPEEVEQIIRLYDAEVAYVDQEVGRFIDRLRELALYDNSLVIIVSDHGEGFYERGHWQHSVSVYEELTRVALIVKWPGNSPKGRIATPVSLVDVFATFLEAVGWQGDSADSRSLMRFFRGSDGELETRTIVSEVRWKPKATSRPMMKIAFRQGALKYIATLAGTEGDMDTLAVHEIRGEELYRLEDDPEERKNLLEDSNIDTEPYRRALRAYLEKARALRADREEGPRVLDEDLKERLRSLGYVVH